MVRNITITIISIINLQDSNIRFGMRLLHSIRYQLEYKNRVQSNNLDLFDLLHRSIGLVNRPASEEAVERMQHE